MCFLCSRPPPRIRPKTTPKQSLKQKQNVRLQTPTTVKTNKKKIKTMIKANVPPPILEDLSPLETIKDSFDMIATSFATTVTIWSNNRFNKNRNPMSSLESEGISAWRAKEEETMTMMAEEEEVEITTTKAIGAKKTTVTAKTRSSSGSETAKTD